jgi:hypothetical protein
MRSQKASGSYSRALPVVSVGFFVVSMLVGPLVPYNAHNMSTTATPPHAAIIQDRPVVGILHRRSPSTSNANEKPLFR